MEKMKTMDREPDEAALKEKLANHRQSLEEILPWSEEKHEKMGKILHWAAWNKQHEFFKEAIDELSKHQLVEKLVCYQERSGKYPGYNPLHVAASVGSHEVVQAITGYYRSKHSDDSYKNLSNDFKPWLANDSTDSTPLHIALQLHNQDCAMEILSLDLESLCGSVDGSGNSPLFLAVKEGHEKVAEEILAIPGCIDTGENGFFTALHYAPNCSSVEVCRLLIKKEVKKGQHATHKSKMPMLHKWIELKKASLLFTKLNDELNKDLINDEQNKDLNSDEMTIESYLVNLISKGDHNNNNAFHIFGKNQNMKASKIIARFYNKHKGEEEKKDLPPWLKQNTSLETPLHLALNHDDKDAYKWVKDTYGDVPFKLNEVGPLVRAVKKRKHEFATQIGETLFRYGWRPFCPDGEKIWQVERNRTDVEVAKWLVDNLPKLIPEDEAAYALKHASRQGYDWLVESVLKEHPFALEKDPLAWKEACTNGHYKTIVAFIENCPNFRELCIRQQTTPLHHIDLKGYEEYRQLVENPVMKGLRNYQDKNGASPLHHAIQTRNMELTELLLKMDDVDLSIMNEDKHTPIKLLHNLYQNKGEVQRSPSQHGDNTSHGHQQGNGEVSQHADTSSVSHRQWKEMCKRNGIIPSLKIIYFRDKTKAYDLRNTVSVVAALLATITFTAGFTVPGGFDQDKGDALLGDKAAFIVFILSDAFAMCCSLVTLVCFMWSVISYPPKSLVLIERSLAVLMLALVSSAMAFMSGVYVVLRQKCLWVAIVIIVLCSSFIILAFSNMSVNRVLIQFSPHVTYIDLEQGGGPIRQEDDPTPTGQPTVTEEDNSSWKFKTVLRFFGVRHSRQRRSE